MSRESRSTVALATFSANSGEKTFSLSTRTRFAIFRNSSTRQGRKWMIPLRPPNRLMRASGRDFVGGLRTWNPSPLKYVRRFLLGAIC